MSATQDIHDLVGSIWKRIDYYAPDINLLQSIRDHVETSPHARVIAERERQSPAMRDFSGAAGRVKDHEIFTHAFRDPIAKIMTIFNGRVEDLNSGRQPVRYLDFVLAKLCFNIENLQTHPFRAMLGIKAEDDSDFTTLLDDIDRRIAPKIRELLPAALNEGGATVEGFEKFYHQFRAEHDQGRSGIYAIRPAEHGIQP